MRGKRSDASTTEGAEKGAGFVSMSKNRKNVQITNIKEDGLTELVFTATGIPFGKGREVVLESYNTLSSVQSALKTDKVWI